FQHRMSATTCLPLISGTGSVGPISFAKLLKRYRLPARLSSAEDVLALIGCVLRRETEPCLAQLSILLGDIESQLTTAPAAVAAAAAGTDDQIVAFPNLNLDQLDKLCNSFCQDVYAMRFDLTKYRTRIEQTCWKFTCPSAAWFPDLLRHVIVQLADRVWARLRHCVGLAELAHCQTLYTLVSCDHHPARLDTFGVCLAVVSACQLLEVPTVRLALSEDHAWLVFGHQLEHSAEVSWAGRTLQSLRGQSVQPEHPAGSGAGSSWLYLNGNAVLCETHWLTLVAMVTSISPRITGGQLHPATASTADHQQHAQLQSKTEATPALAAIRLWPPEMLPSGPDQPGGFRISEPNASATAETTAFSAPGESVAVSLYNEAIRANLVYYNNCHVYPYLALGGYFYRKSQCRQALRYWCLAARTVAQYSYSREDAEIYKELFEVSNELVPRLLRLSADTGVSSDARSLAALLHFYDAICLWEQDSNTPVLHVGWADRIVKCLLLFDPVARQALKISCREGQELTSAEDATKLSNYSPESVKLLKSVAEGCSNALLNPRYLLGLSPTVFLSDSTASKPSPVHSTASSNCSSSTTGCVPVTLRSRKMCGIASLFCQARLNSSAIKLQLTAQSQVHFKRPHQQQSLQSQPQPAASSASATESARAKRLRFRSGSEFCS
uniref:Menin n=1 Tax=Macrostomum lignano TaxID=282301 RepID=A0A1I8GH20_9PLAT